MEYMKYENNQLRIIEIFTLTSRIRRKSMNTLGGVAHISQ